jgi:ABC-type transport system involved in multi-copper enzyme maturation permease subunit
MSSRAIKPKRDTAAATPARSLIEERAPSLVREETPAFPRYVAVFSLMLVTLGGASLLFRAFNKNYAIPPGWGFFLLSIGIAGLLYHSFNERDFQFRRLYAALGGLLLIVGLALRVVPIQGKGVGANFMPWGPLCLLLALGFLLSFVRNEAESVVRSRVIILLGLVGLLLSATGIALVMAASLTVGSSGVAQTWGSTGFMLATGVLQLVIGLLFGVGYVGMEGLGTRRGYRAGLAIGGLGLIMILIAIGWSLVPYLFHRMGWRSSPPTAFFLPSGLILLYLGAEYLVLSLGMCSDNKLVAITRRELGAFFCSPIAYIVLIGVAACGWLQYWIFVTQIFEMSGPSNPMMGGGGQGMPEPIISRIFVSFLALIPMIFLVPIITMRMLSEEKRSGTLEVMLTAPVNEWTIVLGKFFAGLRVFMLCWYTWGIYLVALRIEGGQEFDYRPLLTFLIGLLCMGSGFIAMGLFFSAVTRHQILAAVVSFVVMFALTVLFLVGQYKQDLPWLNTIITYVSYIDFWIVSARGTIVPRYLIMNLSMAVFWLFLTVKVLDARKWS